MRRTTGFVTSVIISALISLVVLSLGGCSRQGEGSHLKELPEPVESGGSLMVSRASSEYFEIHVEDGWRKLLVKGLNVGTALPGRWFSEFPANKELYREWFEQIAETNANAIRVYTLLDPRFYQALDEFNKSSSRKLLLYQEIWPDDEAPGNNLYDPEFTNEYREEIKRDIDALLGEGNIPERKGRAWGEYSVNVFPYLLGLLIGREITWDEARATNTLNPDRGTYAGFYVRSSQDSNAVESWLAETCDFAQGYAAEEHGWQTPVGFVSWPTLDPLEHPTEMTPGGTKESEHEDSEVLNPSHLERGPESRGGLFGCYHIYPYYPDFMNREPAYAEYEDEEGVLRYGGYLRRFKEIHPQYPALIGEFGIPTSLGIAHLHPEGFHHGGVSEVEQGELLSRMMNAIVAERYAGGIIFEWMDEWAKRTWVDMAYMIPFDRHIYWHNVMDPEQNYGLLAYDPEKEAFSGEAEPMWKIAEDGAGDTREAQISSLRVDADEAFLNLELTLAGDQALGLKPDGDSDLQLFIGIDTFGDGNGTIALPVPGLPELPTGVEFLLRIDGKDGGRFLARPDYNRGTSRFAAAFARDDEFVPIEIMVNREQVSEADGTIFPVEYSNESILHYGDFDPESEDYSSLSHWYVDDSGSKVCIRLPWLLLNVSDPSSLTVIHDTRGDLPPGPAALRVDYPRDALETEKTGGFLFYAATSKDGELLDFQPRKGEEFEKDMNRYLWKGWDEPAYRKRLKRSYDEVKDALGVIE